MYSMDLRPKPRTNGVRRGETLLKEPLLASEEVSFDYNSPEGCAENESLLG